MKIGIFFDSQTNAGGGFYLSQSKLELLIKSIPQKHSYKCFITTKSSHDYLKKNGIKNLKLFKIIFFKKIIFFLYQFKMLNKIFDFFNLKNPLESQLTKNEIDLLFFVSPSSFVRFCNSTNFVYNIWEMQHRYISYFPEYNKKKFSQSSYDLREYSYKYAVNKAFKIIVDSERTIEDIKSSYNAPRNDMFEIQAFVPTLPEYYKKIKNNLDFNKLFEELRLPKKKILFYPAQFWPHKNHIYLIKSFENIIKNKVDDFILVFTGHDKGNKNHILNEINKRGLKNKIFIFDYLSLEQIISLYKNSFALTMTSLVGRSSLPLREAFYFELPVFYAGGILDKNYATHVNELKLDDFNDLFNYLNKEKNSINDSKVEKAKQFYQETCNDTVIINNYNKILADYLLKLEYWEQVD